MKQTYESGLYADKNPTWHEEDSPWKAKQIERIIKANNLSFDTVCEIGCGTGDILLNLEKAFPTSTFTGYEISPYAFQRAAVKTTERTSFHLKDLLEEPPSRFDLVLVIDVIEHVEDYIAFLKKLRYRGGHFIFHIPLDLSAQSVLRGSPMIKLRKNVGHLHYFSKNTAIATLEDCGYSIIQHKYTASRLELPNQALSSRLMKAPRRLLSLIDADLTVRLVGGYSLLVLAR